MSEETVVEQAEAAKPSVKITVRPNGPFRVEGLIELVDREQETFGTSQVSQRSRCAAAGSPQKRPFCDGTHGREGWKCDASPVPVEPVSLG